MKDHSSDVVDFEFSKTGRYAEADPAAPHVFVKAEGDVHQVTRGRAEELEGLGRGRIVKRRKPKAEETASEKPKTEDKRSTASKVLDKLRKDRSADAEGEGEGESSGALE